MDIQHKCVPILSLFDIMYCNYLKLFLIYKKIGVTMFIVTITSYSMLMTQLWNSLYLIVIHIYLIVNASSLNLWLYHNVFCLPRKNLKALWKVDDILRLNASGPPFKKKWLFFCQLGIKPSYRILKYMSRYVHGVYQNNSLFFI